ncbi:MAG: hypothetical protein LBQ75_01855 [Zoogloeaceae bacterium]|jgi:hypothetical protein|nr:hypothetical protein [Zoogloeaceae bacterium]
MITLDLLDALRGYLIACVLLSLAIVGVCSHGTNNAARTARITAQITGGIAGLSLFGLFTFVDGWDEYFATQTTDVPSSEYHGHRFIAAYVIRTLGEMYVSNLGIVFGLLGLVLLCAAFVEWFYKR